MRYIVIFGGMIVICIQVSISSFDDSVFLNAFQEQRLASDTDLSCGEPAPCENPRNSIPKLCLDIEASSRCESAWKRVLSRIENNEANDLIQFEFCRFLGVLESEANVSLPDSMLGLEPTIIDPQNRRFIAFRYPFLGRLDKANELTIPDDSERNVGVTEKSNSSDGVSFLVSGYDGEVLISDTYTERILIENHRNLSESQLAVLFWSGEYKLAMFERSHLRPRWSTLVKTTVPAQTARSGPSFKRTVIIETKTSLALLEIGSMEFSLNTFERKTGDLLFHFAIRHGGVQGRTMINPDLDK